MLPARTVFRGSYYFITCAPSQAIAKQQCEAARGAGWEIIPTPPRLGEPAKPNPHTCTCADRGARSGCKHYQFQSPRQAPKPLPKYL